MRFYIIALLLFTQTIWSAVEVKGGQDQLTYEEKQMKELLVQYIQVAGDFEKKFGDLFAQTS